MSQTDDGEPSKKRVRASVACQACRSRKQSCNGDRPCARCVIDNRECLEPVAAQRTPLTRRHMQDLEDKLAQYEQLWNLKFPNGHSGDAPTGETHPVEDLLRFSSSSQNADPNITHATQHEPQMNIGQIPDSGVHSTTEYNSVTHQSAWQSQHWPAPNAVTSHSASASADITGPAVANEATSYPPTRPASPQDLSLRDVYEPHTSSHTPEQEWREPDGVEDDTAAWNPGMLDGMGATQLTFEGKKAGAGYIGLSSSATLLLAIRRLVAKRSASSVTDDWIGTMTLETWGDQPSATSSEDVTPTPFPRFPPGRETMPLVDSYFTYFHTLTPVVHEPTVRAQLTGAVPLRRTTGTRVLFYMIFAMGAVDMASTPDLSRGHRYYREARTALQQGLFEEGSLELVQGLAIMANYLQRTDKPNSGYVCLGLAIRAAITLGLHTKVAVSKMSPLAREMRSRVWWSLVTLEAGCSITFGRPRAIDASVLNSVPLPLNINDEDLTVCDTDTPVELSETTLYSALITQAKLAQKAFDIQDRISRSVPYPNVTQIKWCGDQLKRESLGRFTPSQSNAPAHLRLAQAVQRWRQTDLQCIMYRPVLLSAAVQERFPPTVQEIVNTCRSLAARNLEDISDFVQSIPDEHRGSEWYTLYFAFQASLTLVLSIVWEPGHPLATSWRASLERTTAWFRQLRSMSKLGTSYAQFIEHILATKVATPNMLEFASSDGSTHVPFPEGDTLDFERYLNELCMPFVQDPTPAAIDSTWPGDWNSFFS